MTAVNQALSDAAAGFTEDSVDADGFTIRCLAAGEGDPIVYLHGGGGLHVSPAHRLLAERFRVTMFELPGFGASAENTHTTSLDGMADTMAAAIAAAGIDAYTLYGTSFGGAVALRVALAHPDRVRAL
ncbi:MAG: alpha/beta fold hydrolase, partial [Solirubrobacteraceae bacterium]